MISSDSGQIEVNKPNDLKAKSDIAPIHHICTDKNCISEANGGPWTPRFKVFFDNAGIDMQDALNKVIVEGHQGPHPERYMGLYMADCLMLQKG